MNNRTLVLSSCVGLLALLLACTLSSAPSLTPHSPDTTPVLVLSATLGPVTPPATVLILMTAQPKISPGATYAIKTSPLPPVSATSTPTRYAPTQIPIPASAFSATITFTVSATELQVSDMITVAFRLTNVGETAFRNPSCGVAFYDEKQATWRYSSTSFTGEKGQYPLGWTWSNDLPPGQSFQGKGVLRAVTPGSISVRVECSGTRDAVVGSTVGHIVGVNATSVTLHIR